jgi:pre-mRNA-splicing factor SYF1
LNDVLHKFLAKKTYCRFPNSSFSETKKHQIKNVTSSSKQSLMVSSLIKMDNEITDQDLIFEENVLQNPYVEDVWDKYIQFLVSTTNSSSTKLLTIHERAVKANPKSRNLWLRYLRWRMNALKTASTLTSPLDEELEQQYNKLNLVFERCIANMESPGDFEIWELYIKSLWQDQCSVTKTRRACDRALQSLDITEHSKFWSSLYLPFIRSSDKIPIETACRVYRRYVQFEPQHVEEYISFLKNRGRVAESSQRLVEILNDETFVSLLNKSKHQMWLELCDLITKNVNNTSVNNTEDGKKINVSAILRTAIKKFTDEVGKLWASLADYYIRRGLFEKARDIYEEGLESVMTVRDFSLIFDAYAAFEENVLSSKMMQEEEEEEENDEIELRLARLEHLMERRPILLSSVMLRQNPHNVHEWLKRISLLSSSSSKEIVSTYSLAIQTVDAKASIGSISQVWIDFAKFYEVHGDLDNARVIFEKATKSPNFKSVDELATIWCEYAEFELRNKNFKQALTLMKRVLFVNHNKEKRINNASNTTKGEYDALLVQEKVHKSIKLWMFYCDLEESISPENARIVYERILDLRIATPQIILNYAAMLQESKFFEDSFHVYERGVNLFKFPHSIDIWRAYLTQFVDRFQDKKVERARDLFEQCCEQAPPKDCKEFFLEYAKLEEQFGLSKRAMDIYDQALTKMKSASDKIEVLDIYVKRAMDFFGVGKVRSIYEKIIEDDDDDDDDNDDDGTTKKKKKKNRLDDNSTKIICVKYAELEVSLGEIDRARALYTHASQFSNPAQDGTFWGQWNDFEVKNGNEDTFRDMLRVKRSVAASFSQMHFNMSVVEVPADALEPQAGGGGGKEGEEEEDLMKLLEREELENRNAAPIAGFVKSHVVGGDRDDVPKNPEEIDLGFDDEEEEGDDDEPKTSVPSGVYGSLLSSGGKKREREDDEEEE